MPTSITTPSLSNLQVNTWSNIYSSTPIAGFTGTVRVVVQVNSGALKLGSGSTGVMGVTGYGNLYDGTATSIAFEGTQTQVNTALQSLQAYNNNANASPALTISAVKGGPAYNPVNGHYYEFFSAAGISWTDAKAATASKTFNGLQGYLVTITSQQENDFAAARSVGKEGWIGASDSKPNMEGNWQWHTGPEGGLQPDGTTRWLSIGIDKGDTFDNLVNGSYRYHNFYINQPDNLGGVENYAYMRADGTWNDYSNTNTVVKGYLVEYGGYSNDNPIEAARSISATLTVVAPPVITSNGGSDKLAIKSFFTSDAAKPVFGV